MFLSLTLGKFYGIDSIVEFLIIIVAAVLAYSSYKIYRLIKEDCYKNFSLAFLLISLSFLFKILSNLTIIHRVKIEKTNIAMIMVSQLKYMQLINFSSNILFMLFNVTGFLILFFIVTKTSTKDKRILYIYLTLLSVLLSIYFNFIFEITLVIFLFVLSNYFYYNYKKNNTINSFLVYISFLIMLISHIFLAFSGINSLFYLFGEILLLASFSMLLINHIKIRIDQRQTIISKSKRKRKK